MSMSECSIEQHVDKNDNRKWKYKQKCKTEVVLTCNKNTLNVVCVAGRLVSHGMRIVDTKWAFVRAEC